MFSSARLTTIILSVIALGLTLSAPVDAGEVTVEKKVKLEAGGLTVAGPGIAANLPPTQPEGVIVYRANFARSNLSATIHCRRGTGKVLLELGFGIVQMESKLSNKDRTASVTAQSADRVRVICDASSPVVC